MTQCTSAYIPYFQSPLQSCENAPYNKFACKVIQANNSHQMSEVRALCRTGSPNNKFWLRGKGETNS